jgi:hypothetical protein
MTVTAMGLSEVSNILWRERQLLELLLFKLEVEQLLLASGRTRWLAHAAREIEDILDAIKNAELARAVEVESLATDLGLPNNASLRELAEVAPAPWKHILEEHRAGFITATQEIAGLATSNRELIIKGQRDVHEALSWLGEAPDDTYSSSGNTSVRQTAARLIDRTL